MSFANSKVFSFGRAIPGVAVGVASFQPLRGSAKAKFALMRFIGVSSAVYVVEAFGEARERSVSSHGPIADASFCFWSLAGGESEQIERNIMYINVEKTVQSAIHQQR